MVQMLLKMFQGAFHEFVSLIKNQFVEKSFPPLLSIREKFFFFGKSSRSTFSQLKFSIIKKNAVAAKQNFELNLDDT